MASITPNGKRWRAQVRKAGFADQSKSFRTKALAEAWATNVESGMAAGSTPATAALRKLTVEDLLVRFKEEVSPTRKGCRWETTRINRFVREDSICRLRLDKDIPAALRDWIASRQKCVSNDTIARELNLLAGIFKHAIKVWGIPLPGNPTHLVQRPSCSRGRDKTWKEADLVRFKAALGDVQHPPARLSDWLWPVAVVASETAMRRSEIYSILKEDVHLEERWLQVRDSKNGDARKIPLSTKAIEAIRPLMELKGDRVFEVNTGSASQEFRTVALRAGLGELRFHDLRHTATTRLSKKFDNILQLAAVTGHRSLTSLKRYYNPDVTDLAARLD